MKNEASDEKIIKEKDNKVQYKISLIILILTITFVGIFTTYAFFQTPGNSNQNEKVSVEAGNMSLIFSDGTPGFSKELEFGGSADKTFSIENNGSMDGKAKINWKNLINTYTEKSLTYSLKQIDDTGREDQIIDNELVPRSDNPTTIELANNLKIPSKKTYSYVLTITLNYLESTDQTADLNAKLETEFEIENDDNKALVTLDTLNLKSNNSTPNFNIIAPHINYVDDNFKGPVTKASNDLATNCFIKFSNYTFDSDSQIYNILDFHGYSPMVVYSFNLNDYEGYIAPYDSKLCEALNYSDLEGSGAPLSFGDQALRNRKDIYKVSNCSGGSIGSCTIIKSSFHTESIDKSEDGVYSMEDDYGMSYYFRGAIENNYVKFGKWASDTPDVYIGYDNGQQAELNGWDYNPNIYTYHSSQEDCQNDKYYNKNCTLLSRAGKPMYWRIIRVNGDGSLRLLYDGTEPHVNGDMSPDRNAFHNEDSKCGDAKYLGYMYGPSDNDVNYERVPSTSKEQAQMNEIDSGYKKELEEWYRKNLKDYDEYISDNIFCNDRSIPGKSVTGVDADTELGYGINPTWYGAFGRLVNYNKDMVKENSTPSLKCIQKNDAFTKNDKRRGNGKLGEKVGLVTVDEAVLAGEVFGLLNKENYMSKESRNWTMSPSYSDGLNYMFILGNTIQSCAVSSSFISLSPVINLSSEYVKNLSGDGTRNNPFTLE